MIRFVNLTNFYWFDDEVFCDPSDPPKPCCAFICTVNDRFVESCDGEQIFDSLEEIYDGFPDDSIIEPMVGRTINAERLVSLLPDDFFVPKVTKQNLRVAVDDMIRLFTEHMKETGRPPTPDDAETFYSKLLQLP